MAISVKLKKILSDGTYGEAFDFEFGQANSTWTRNSGTDPHGLYTTSGVTGGTNLSVLWVSDVGTRWQAFDANDNKLGFIIAYLGQNGNSSREYFSIYNEEIQGGIIALQAYTSDRSRECKFVISKDYEADTIEGVLEKASALYTQELEQYIYGMGCNKYSIIQICSRESSSKWFTNEYKDSEGQRDFPKMRFFSSWYKLLTGKFYKQDELFAMALEDGSKFYFGKVLKFSTSTVRTEDVETMETYTDADNSVLYYDVIYGTNPASKILNFSQEIAFANGLRLSYANPQWNNGNDPKWFYPTISKIGTSGTAKINWRVNSVQGWKGAEGISGFHGIYTSPFRAIENTPDLSTLLRSWYSIQGVDMFITPQYNQLNWRYFNDELSNVEYTAEQWKNVGKVFTFARTDFLTLSSDIATSIGFATATQVAITGWAKFVSGSFGDTALNCSTYYPNDSNLENNFDSVDKWKSILTFVYPGEGEDPEPGPSPEPEPEPTPTEEEEGPFSIAQLAALAIETGVPFLGTTAKLQGFEFMEEYLDDYENFDEDIKETRGFLIPVAQKATKALTLEKFISRSQFTIKKHAKELAHLWEIANAEFDPIYNVEEHIDETVKKTGSDTLRDAIDQVVTNNSYGSQSAEHVKGSQTDSNSIGNKTTETANEKAGMNSANYQKDTKSTMTEGAQSNSSTSGSRTDSDSVAAHSDTSTVDYREDVHEQTFDNTVTRKYDRKGNVGTMSSPELLEKAANANEVFDFYNKLYDLILGELATYSDDGIEPFGRR